MASRIWNMSVNHRRRRWAPLSAYHFIRLKPIRSRNKQYLKCAGMERAYKILNLCLRRFVLCLFFTALSSFPFYPPFSLSFFLSPAFFLPQRKRWQPKQHKLYREKYYNLNPIIWVLSTFSFGTPHPRSRCTSPLVLIYSHVSIVLFSFYIIYFSYLLPSSFASRIQSEGVLNNKSTHA